jgi:hypothetical protein
MDAFKKPFHGAANLESLVMTLAAIRYVILIRYEMHLIIIWVKDYDVHGKLWRVRFAFAFKVTKVAKINT